MCSLLCDEHTFNVAFTHSWCANFVYMQYILFFFSIEIICLLHFNSSQSNELFTLKFMFGFSCRYQLCSHNKSIIIEIAYDVIFVDITRHNIFCFSHSFSHLVYDLVYQLGLEAHANRILYASSTSTIYRYIIAFKFFICYAYLYPSLKLVYYEWYRWPQ